MVYPCIETTPYYSIKCEMDKQAGYLLLDSPLRTPSQLPCTGSLPAPITTSRSRRFAQGR